MKKHKYTIEKLIAIKSTIEAELESLREKEKLDNTENEDDKLEDQCAQLEDALVHMENAIERLEDECFETN